MLPTNYDLARMRVEDWHREADHARLVREAKAARKASRTERPGVLAAVQERARGNLPSASLEASPPCPSGPADDARATRVGTARRTAGVDRRAGGRGTFRTGPRPRVGQLTDFPESLPQDGAHERSWVEKFGVGPAIGFRLMTIQTRVHSTSVMIRFRLRKGLCGGLFPSDRAAVIFGRRRSGATGAGVKNEARLHLM